MVADTTTVVKEIKRKPADLTEQERELQHTLEESAKGASFPGTKEELEKALAPMEPASPEADTEIVLDENRVKQAFQVSRMLAEVVVQRLDRGIHYGIIPGTQQESLLDPGSATLMNVARCRPHHKVLEVREEEDGHIVLLLEVELIYIPSGHVVATGVGAASTHETKYAYRWVEEHDVPAGLDRATLKQRVRNRETYYRVQNPDLGDLWNTLLKMAAKRAESDAAQHLPGVAEGLARIRQNGR